MEVATSGRQGLDDRGRRLTVAGHECPWSLDITACGIEHSRPARQHRGREPRRRLGPEPKVASDRQAAPPFERARRRQVGVPQSPDDLLRPLLTRSRTSTWFMTATSFSARTGYIAAVPVGAGGRRPEAGQPVTVVCDGVVHGCSQPGQRRDPERHAGDPAAATDGAKSSPDGAVAPQASATGSDPPGVALNVSTRQPDIMDVQSLPWLDPDSDGSRHPPLHPPGEPGAQPTVAVEHEHGHSLLDVAPTRASATPGRSGC